MCLKKESKEVKKNNETLSQLFERCEEDIYIDTETETSKELLKELLRLQDSFMKSLSKEQQKELNKIDRIKLKYDAEINKSMFIYGYKLAVNTIIESIKK